MRYLKCIAMACGLLAVSQCSTPVWAADPLAGLSDDFSSAATHSNWKRLDKVEGTSPTFTTLDFGKTRHGFLTIVPTTSVWYMNETGTMLFKSVQGNFMITAHVVTHAASSPSSPPRNPFNSAGVIARDPSSTSGRQNWVVCNVGMQQSSTGSEVKSTRDSNSELHLVSGAPEGEVRLARIGSTFTMLRRLRGEGSWRVIGSMSRPDLPSTLQVGIMCNGYQSADLIAQYDYVHYATPHSRSDLMK